MLLTTIAAIVIGFQRNRAPNALAVSYPPQKQVRWVFLGWGSYSETAKALQARHVKFWPISWLDTPSEYLMMMPDPEKTKEPAGFLVDIEQYAADRQVVQQLMSNGLSFKLVPVTKRLNVVFPGPPDADLRQRFTMVRPDLEKIMKIALANPTLDAVRLPSAYGDINEHKGPAADAIIALLKQIGPTLGVFHYGPDDWQIPAWGFGNTTSAEYEKGFVYVLHQPTAIVRSLDNFPPSEKKRLTQYVRLDGHWCLYAEFIP